MYYTASQNAAQCSIDLNGPPQCLVLKYCFIMTAAIGNELCASDSHISYGIEYKLLKKSLQTLFRSIIPPL